MQMRRRPRLESRLSYIAGQLRRTLDWLVAGFRTYTSFQNAFCKHTLMPDKTPRKRGGRDHCSGSWPQRACDASGRRGHQRIGVHDARQIATPSASAISSCVAPCFTAASVCTLHDLAELGVRRASVGGRLARAAWGGFMRAARDLADGRFDGFEGAASGAQLNALFLGHA